MSAVTMSGLLVVLFMATSSALTNSGYQYGNPGSLSRRSSTSVYGSSGGFDSTRAFIHSVSRSRPRLFYHDGVVEGAGSLSTSTLDQQPGGKPTTEKDGDLSSQQEIVDEYLQFLDRRYNRLYQGDAPSREPKFSGLKWIMQDFEEGSTQQGESEDALFVLGVANLASKKLLQKYVRSKAALPSSVAFIAGGGSAQAQAQAATVDTSSISRTRAALVVAMLTARIVPVFDRLVTLRAKLLLFQASNAKIFARFVVAAMAELPSKMKKGAKAAIEFGGGKETVAITASVAAAMAFLVVRVAVQSIVTGSTSRA